jgi:uncharacterized protein (DUF302 family)
MVMRNRVLFFSWFLFTITLPIKVDGRVGSRGGGGDDTAKGMVVVESVYDFETTWSNVITALENNPNVKIVAQIDHAQAAESARLELSPNRLVVFGNPAAGTPLMQEQISVALDLPQKMLVWQADSSAVYVGYNSVEYLEGRHPGVEDAATFEAIGNALSTLAKASSGSEDLHVNNNDMKSVEEHKGLRTKRSDSDFETTWMRLIDAVEASPANIAFTVDHGQNAVPEGALNPTRLVVFGNPNLGTPLMQDSATTGVDLPLKIVVWQDGNGIVKVTTNGIRFLKRRHGLSSKLKDQLDAIEMAVENFVRVATETT